MNSGVNKNYLLTIWPGPISPIPLARVEEVSLNGEWLELAGQWVAPVSKDSRSEFGHWIDEKQRVVELPRELYLRDLRELDMSDPAAILGFTQTYGLVAHDDWRGLGEVAHDALIGHHGMAAWCDQSMERLAKTVRDELEQRTKLPFSVGALHNRRFFHLSEVKLHIAALRNMVRLRQVIQGQMTPEEAADEWENVPVFVIWGPPLPDPTHPDPIPGDTALQIMARDLVKLLNYGLAEFTVRASCDETPGKPRRRLGASTYGILCLQLANHIAEQATYRHCAACGRLFVRKDDPRYTGEQNRVRSGLKYCSDTCTNRVAKRAQLNRKRRRIEGKESDHG